MKLTLLKLTLRAAFDQNDLTQLTARTLGDAVADVLRHDGALTVMSDSEVAKADMPKADDGDSDKMIERLERRFPLDGLTVGPLPGTRMLGKNTTYTNARLVSFPGRLELWLGTEGERFPLLVFLVNTARTPP
jgi:hypothetical protein